MAGLLIGSVSMCGQSLQLCPTPCDPMDCSPPGSSVHRILQAGILEWVAISFSNAWQWKVKMKSLSRVWLLATPWTAAYQAPPSMGFSRQEYWSGLPLLSTLGCYRALFGFPERYSKFLLAIYFTYGNINVSMLLSSYISPSASLSPCPYANYICLFSHCF